MADCIIGTAALSIATLIGFHAVVGRILGFHRDVTWGGGGSMTFVAELSAAGFVASIGGGFAFGGLIFILTALPCWVIGYVSQERANRRYRQEEEELRENNSKRHPGTFDSAPPTSLDLERSDKSRFYWRFRQAMRMQASVTNALSPFGSAHT